MARLTILAAVILLAAMLVTANSQGTEQSRCTQEVSQRNMETCRAYIGSLGNTAQTGQCCNEITPISEQCRCEALRSNYLQYTGSERPRARELAEYMPAVCGWQNPTRCNFANV